MQARSPGRSRASAAEIAATTSAGSRSRRPITGQADAVAPAAGRPRRAGTARTGASAIRTSSARPAPSCPRRRRRGSGCRSPSPGAASTTRRTASAPARCPAERGSPRRVAQRPLPSMMMATWIPWTDWKYFACQSLLAKKLTSAVSAVSVSRVGADQGFHVVEIARELAAAHRGEPILRPRPPAVEALGARARSRLPRACGRGRSGCRRSSSSSALISLNVSDSSAASALTMPSRMRWWMSLSRLAEPRRGAVARRRAGAPRDGRGAERSARCRRPRSNQPPCLLPTITPKAMCSPPKPAIRSQLLHAGGSSRPAAPRTMKVAR